MDVKLGQERITMKELEKQVRMRIFSNKRQELKKGWKN
jgi:hypothetical protein